VLHRRSRSVHKRIKRNKARDVENTALSAKYFNDNDSNLLDLLDPKLSEEGGIEPVDRVVVHLEQVAIANTHFRDYTTDFGELLQRRAPDLSTTIVKLSSSNLHRRLGPTSKLGTKIIQACHLEGELTQSDYKEKKERSQRIFKYVMECAEEDLDDAKISIHKNVREWWENSKPETNDGDTFISGRLHDLGDAFLHAINEIVYIYIYIY